MLNIHGTTIVAVKRDGAAAIAGDGQVTFGEKMIMKHKAKKVRRLYQGKVLAGFAGTAADAFTLFDKFEAKLEQYHGNLTRAAVELAKEWRTDRMLRQLEALLVVMDRERLFVISGTGEIIEPDDDFVAIGSGGPFAQAACQALYRYTDLSAAEIAKEAIRIAASICVYTNEYITVEELSGGA
ncbi:MAG TPA: ATP-dependent protease subunit HslV [Firmicutes bacterium]|nr:ATP-dependent protease subunit HslV [Bacillota bacterium]